MSSIGFHGGPSDGLRLSGFNPDQLPSTVTFGETSLDDAKRLLLVEHRYEFNDYSSSDGDQFVIHMSHAGSTQTPFSEVSDATDA